MAWIAVGVAGAGMAMNYMNNQQAKKRDQANMMANAAQIQYSPWTGMKSQMQGPTAQTGDLAAIMSGGLQGAALGSQFGKGMKAPETPSPVAGSPELQPVSVGDSMKNAAPAAGPNLGGAQMAQGLQSQNLPSSAEMQTMAANGELAPGNPWMQMKKPTSFYSGR